jgi:hypothetical protein
MDDARRTRQHRRTQLLHAACAASHGHVPSRRMDRRGHAHCAPSPQPSTKTVVRGADTIAARDAGGGAPHPPTSPRGRQKGREMGGNDEQPWNGSTQPRTISCGKRDARARRSARGVGRCAAAHQRERHALPADANRREHQHDRVHVGDDDEPELHVDEWFEHGGGRRGNRLGTQPGDESRAALHRSEHDERCQWNGRHPADHGERLRGGARVGEWQHDESEHHFERYVRVDERRRIHLGDDDGLRAVERRVAVGNRDRHLDGRRQPESAGAEQRLEHAGEHRTEHQHAGGRIEQHRSELDAA